MGSFDRISYFLKVKKVRAAFEKFENE